ncbi:DivIVA domain-containing protein [Solirubrobacter ginsenosidimutans]|uniref:DivIVA domain-containing protein n=1 Tax=Solirubrobacter ginsenosidimutans TaxID=490573 RepID=A0A9X3S9Q4_9ACTN|nr:DivIVA domain-containing protein [Solirubrobacter ginsenosidimutans]MDA0165253.1 DivIVA domain-containing protein [Solirubrobacter ginsenosidimutans]
MDRDRIERRDFPTGRRGYDPAAVDEHLRRVADEFEARAHAPAPSMADSTSEQVRLILAAAERGAAEMRATAGTEASDHVARVQAAADGMLGKLDALESELTRLLSALRTSGERLVEGLAELQSAATLGEPRAAAPPPAAAGDATDPRGVDLPGAAAPPTDASSAEPPADLPSPVPPRAATEPTVPTPADGEQAPSPASPSPTSPSPDAPGADSPGPVADAPTSPDSVSPSPEAESAAHETPPLSAPDAPDWPAPAEALFDAAPAGDAVPDEAGARLIALNMALGGSPRDDTRIFLEEHFELPDIEALLDDVYARAGR